MSQSKSTPIVLDTASWVPNQFRFMPPKVNDKGGKSISLISTQSGRGLHVSTPLLTTWGISDFTDPATGVSDGKYQISFSFPKEQYATKNTELFLSKMQEFEQAILDAAVQNSELWWGEALDKGILKHTFFPILKYPKVAGTKKPDLTKTPNLNAKVPFYEADNKWNVEIYDTKGELLFPNSNEELVPSHFVPRLSSAAAVLQCGGIWIGGKGWGVTWKLVQAVVKPKQTESVFGKCHIQLSDEDQDAMKAEPEPEDLDDVPAPAPAAAESKAAPSTLVADSDDDEPKASAKAEAKPAIKKPAPAPAKEEAPAPAPAAAPVAAAPKKIVKKPAAAPK